MPNFDDVDAVLLRALQHDARQTNRQLAATAGVSPSTALERVRRLERAGVIVGYHAEIDLHAVGRTVQAMVSVRIRPPARAVLEGFRTWLGGLAEVIGVFVTTGTSDLLVHVAVADTDALYAFVVDRLMQRKEVTDVQTSIVYRHHRSGDVVPGWGAPG